ncbi:XVIPCD domain-containing protein [Stenotrophomonas sp. CFBP 13724]|uniref:XVIPCD domain-containing protein n=1 Tax=Stenotrophomonas sp. CFBP 13724 TaxID=2775298 RepID=UPI00201780E5|nr:XVIPCD domain-containing protein [Stenotrophomonas sp. CFBP 13724]
MDQNDRYTVTIYAAAPGTPLINPERPDAPRETSLTGHMYLKVSHGEEARSMGWQPGGRTPEGYLGRVSPDDVDTYVDPYYARTIEVTREQYEKIQEFGRAPTRLGFDPSYNAFSNGCTDFTWGALNHAGLHANVGPVPFKEFEGIMQPAKNIPAIESIKAPFPDSDLNKVERNPMPERDWKQFLLSDNDRAMMDQVNRGVASLDAAHGRTPDENSERMCGSLFCLAKENGLSRVDHVLLSQANEQGHAGTNVFVVQGDPSDPAHLRASMPTAVAAQTPVHESMEQAQHINQSQHQVAMQEQSQVQEQLAAVQRMG